MHGAVLQPKLEDLLKPERLSRIVDVGAAAIEAIPPWLNMLNGGLCTVVGFEPQTEFWPKPIARMTYLPAVIGDGRAGILNICRAPGMASLLLPDRSVPFEMFAEWGNVTKRIPVQTERLDDIDAVESIDFLKIDAQGSELSIIHGANQKLADAAFVQVEVQFIPLYVDQPMFRDIDAALASLGFVPHKFAALDMRTILPHSFRDQPKIGSQLLSADLIYVRDFRKLEELSVELVKHMAMIAQYCFGSLDLVYRCFDHLSRCGAIMAESALYFDTVRDWHGRGSAAAAG